MFLATSSYNTTGSASFVIADLLLHELGHSTRFLFPRLQARGASSVKLSALCKDSSMIVLMVLKDPPPSFPNHFFTPSWSSQHIRNRLVSRSILQGNALRVLLLVHEWLLPTGTQKQAGQAKSSVLPPEQEISTKPSIMTEWNL